MSRKVIGNLLVFSVLALLVLSLNSCIAVKPPAQPAPSPAPTTPAPTPAPEFALAAPRLLSPSNHANEVELTPVLLWQPVENAKGYEVTVSRNYDFSDIVLDASCRLTAYRVTDELIPATHYYWMVCAELNPADPSTPTTYSEIWEFTTASTAPAPTQASTSAPDPEQLLSRHPFPNHPEQMKQYVTPDNSAVKALVDDILHKELKVFSDFEELRDWASWYITYKFDSDVHSVSEYWQLPAETLELRTGDCEDFAILLCSMLRAYGVPSNQVYVAGGYGEDKTRGHAYLVEKWYRGIWRVIEPQAGVWSGLFLRDWLTSESFEEVCCFNDQDYFKGSPTLPPGVYEFEVDNSLYPLTRGASVEFECYLDGGQKVITSVEWLENYAIVNNWSFNIYAPDGTTKLTWSGTDLQHSFNFTPITSGTYKVEILKRDALARCARLTIDPPDWEQK